MSITLVAGLGNPGKEYENTRHNLGFIVLNAWAHAHGLAWTKHRPSASEITRCEYSPGHSLILAKPLTFMNESGRSLQSLASYHKIPVASMIVLYDDLNIDLGLVKVSISGSAGGHNGVSSLLSHLGDGFIRYRLGIGPKQPAQIDLKDFVLGKFTPDQQTILAQTLAHYTSGLDLLLKEGVTQAMNTLNRRETK